MPRRSRATSRTSPISTILRHHQGAGRTDRRAGVNAGVYEFGTLGEITEEHFDKTFNTNVRGLLFTVQKALPLLTKGSSVILTGSMVSIKGFAACSVYNASKAAVRSFARTWIVDLKGRDIRINVLSPGYTDTPGLSHFMTDQETRDRSSLPSRSDGSASRTISARRRCSSLPTTVPTSPALSCSWTAARFRLSNGSWATNRVLTLCQERQS